MSKESFHVFNNNISQRFTHTTYLSIQCINVFSNDRNTMRNVNQGKFELETMSHADILSDSQIDT